MLRLVIVSALVALACAVPQVRRPTLDGRIVGGEEVSIEDYPYQVSLLSRGSHICGGSIIGAKWVVTAAHCTDGASASSLSIRAGSSSRTSGGTVLNVLKINQNPEYDSWDISNDMTVLELDGTLPLGTAGYETIDLPVKDQPIPDGQAAVTSGWGTTSEGGSLPANLRAVEVPMVSNEKCGEAYGAGMILESMNCAGVLGVGGKDACQGDSGGPLVSGGQLVGVVSWGYGCARPDYPGVYGSVPFMRNFVSDISGI